MLVFYIYFIKPLATSGTHIDYTIVFIIIILPLIFLYILGLYFNLISEEYKRETIGWVMILYAFTYILFLNLFLFSGVSAPSGSGSRINAFPPYIISDFLFILNIIAIYYLFEGLLFFLHRMKRHLLGVVLCIIILIGLFFATAG